MPEAVATITLWPYTSTPASQNNASNASVQLSTNGDGFVTIYARDTDGESASISVTTEDLKKVLNTLIQPDLRDASLDDINKWLAS